MLFGMEGLLNENKLRWDREAHWHCVTFCGATGRRRNVEEAWRWGGRGSMPKGVTKSKEQSICAVLNEEDDCSQWLGELCGGSKSSWQGQPCQIGQRVLARRSVVPGPPDLVLGVGLANPSLQNLLLWSHGGGQEPYRVVTPGKKKKNFENFGAQIDIRDIVGYKIGEQWQKRE
jgi:hypothetical protein